jgi:hypothetical protein
MLPPSNASSGSYVDLLKRLTQRVQQAGTTDQVLELLQRAFERELAQQSVVLSRPERVRLFKQVTKAVLTDLLEKLDDGK